MESSSKEISLPLGWLRWILGLSTAAVLACVLLFVAVLVIEKPQQRLALVPMEANARAATEQESVVYYGNDERTLMRHSASLAPMPITAPTAANYERASGTYSADNYFFSRGIKDALANGPVGDKPYAAFDFTEPARNYGIPGGIKMAYDADVSVQVKDALAEGRKALRVVREQGGFVMDFSFGNDEGERPWATLRGKVPADKAEATLAAMEKMGRVRALTIAGEDLTEQFQQQMDEINKQNEHAEKLGKLEDKARRTYAALQAEQQRHYAKEQAALARRLLHGLAAKHDLVEFSASFVEERPRERMHFTQVVTGTQAVLTFSLLLLATVAVLLLLVGLIAAPWMVGRYLRAKR